MTTITKTDNDTVQSSTRTQWTSIPTENEVRVVTALGQREIADEAAMTIAAWWHGGRTGRHLATLAAGRPVNLTDLLEDISTARRMADTKLDEQMLDCLATWAINHPSRRPA